MLRAATLLTLAFALAACGQGDSEPVQRVALGETGIPATTASPDPDTTLARWIVRESGQALDFALPGAPPLLSLECSPTGNPPGLRIVRHHPAFPGDKALFPVVGNGTISRFKVDAVLEGGEWRWQGNFTAADPLFDVFTGPREMEATLPGGGTLLIGPSRLPGQFVEWCRAGGKAPVPEPSDPASSPAPSR